MSGKGASRNSPCPCGSGRKFKHCCIDKGIDWEARQAKGRNLLPAAALRPRGPTLQGFAPLGPFRAVDARLRELAQVVPDEAVWKSLIENLSDATTDQQRIAAYRALNEARVLPENVVLFLFGHAIQWMPSQEDDLDEHIVSTLRRFGQDEQAEHYERDRLDYDRCYECGRQFFFGPPDDALAAHLRNKGIID